jgi:hypothetical protein
MTASTKDAPMTTVDSRTLWNRWIGLWNGDLAELDLIIHPEFILHRSPPPPTGGPVRGRDGLGVWIHRTRTLFAGLHFTVEVGPIVDGDLVAGRWVADGIYQGGIPGATAAAGTRVRFHGNDIWCAEGGQIREY